MVTSSAHTLSDLLDLSGEVLKHQEASDKGIEVLERYCLAFDEWFNINESLIRSKDPSIDSEQLQQLLLQHQEVLNLSERLQHTFPQSLRELRQRGRGILAYTDLLPKKISYAKPKKG